MASQNLQNSKTSTGSGHPTGLPTGEATPQTGQAANTPTQSSSTPWPAISLPQGGGSAKGMGEKLKVNPSTGTASLSVPIITTPGRGGMDPSLSLSYDSGTGNGPFGLGWSLSPPSITRKTDRGLPCYRDYEDSDVYLLSGSEDLVPALEDVGGENGEGYTIRRYMPRVESAFIRIERWTHRDGKIHWRTISPDNVTSIFGGSLDSIIFDPDAPEHVFSWLISESYDIRGNAIVYQYKKENSEGVDLNAAYEASRSEAQRASNSYLKQIKYGNRRPNRDIDSWVAKSARTLRDDDWMFTVVFDYGEHDKSYPKIAEEKVWACRSDPFSTRRAGFEIRTYRLCERVLMFHHFPNELRRADYLVNATEFNYDHHPAMTYLRSAQHSGYVWEEISDTYRRNCLPPLEFEYSQSSIIGQDLTGMNAIPVPAESVQNLPAGVDGSLYRWLDLDGEGLPGVLTRQGNGWFYMRNQSANNIKLGSTWSENEGEKVVPKLSPAELVRRQPSMGGNEPNVIFSDIQGDGLVDLVKTNSAAWGFHKRLVSPHDGSDWSPFNAFPSFPNIDITDRNARFIDLTGDGLPDILITGDCIFTWYQSQAARGYSESHTVPGIVGEARAPQIVFSDAEQAIYLADMTGDGLSDIVRIRRGSVCYWPNIGYGRFGSQICMGNAPWFAHRDAFNQQCIRLADVDGSGYTDILYLRPDGIDVYLNLCGNKLSSIINLSATLPIDRLSTIDAVDLLGNGTVCLVWSCSLPDRRRSPMKFIDLMQGVKPHLLTKVVNNVGAETEFLYAPSTKFYLDDIANGHPWLTRLPFPVQCVEKMITADRISHNVFTTRYAYHHGCFDGKDREFRGFGMVEQWDAEAYYVPPGPDSDDVSEGTPWYTPPVRTKTWFHLGMLPDDDDYTDLVAREYFDWLAATESCSSKARRSKSLLEKSDIPSDLTTAQLQETHRALKGQVLRTEVYSDDGSAMSHLPFTLSETNYTAVLLQKEGDAHGHGVCVVYPRESITVNMEREVDSSRIQHHLVLETDRWGNVLREAKVAYGKRGATESLSEKDQTVQNRDLITYHENYFTEAIVDLPDNYLLPRTSRNLTYELQGFQRNPNELFDINTFRPGTIDCLHKLSFESGVGCEGPSRRLAAESCLRYRSDDLKTLLPLGRTGTMSVAGEGYRLALTRRILEHAFSRQLDDSSRETLIPEPGSILEGQGASSGGYVDLFCDGRWWAPTGRSYFHSSTLASTDQELQEARKHFFLVRRQTDPFGHDSWADFDPYDLIMTRTSDAVDSVVESRIDYRVLRPYLVIDPNKNRTACAFDELGFVVGTAMMGKEGEAVGDSLADFQPYIGQVGLDAFFCNPTGPLATELLGSASTRTIYDPMRYWRGGGSSRHDPVYEVTISREEHVNGGESTASRNQVRINYYDGFNRNIQSKFQAEPERGSRRDMGDSAVPRWVGSGWTIYNNKGDAVKKYEPFFDNTHEFVRDQKKGVSPTIIYDPLSRVVAVLNPNHTWTKSIYRPWEHISYDVNDTVLQRPDNDRDISRYVESLPESDYLPTWYEARCDGSLGEEEKQAAHKAGQHDNTPSVTHADPLGRPFVTVSDNGVLGKYSASISYDIQGNQVEVRDALMRNILRSDHDMLGNQIHNASLDSGERWTLKDVTGRPIHIWDSRGQHLVNTYDALRRPTGSTLSPGTVEEKLVERIIYGDVLQNPEMKNCRGQVVKVFDQSGVSTSDVYDFKGNLLHSTRQLAVEYKEALNWLVDVPLLGETHTSGTSYDALNRPVEMIIPDGSCVRYSYNEAGLLERICGKVSEDVEDTLFVQGIDYNAKGQRARIDYGNSTSTTYTYDPLTFKLATVVTTRAVISGFSGSKGNRDIHSSKADKVQHLEYTYDPIGNITSIRDRAQERIFFRNQVIDPISTYTYDPIYRLIAATGREHIGQSHHPAQRTNTRDHSTRGYLPGDGNAMQTYLEEFRYDSVGNFLEVRHQGNKDTNSSWTRTYQYQEPSQLDPSQVGNRLTSTMIGSVLEQYRYDGDAAKHGNMTSMPQLPLMQWNYKDQLHATARQACGDSHPPEMTYYTYDAKGQRVRKISERCAGPDTCPEKVKERIYLGDFEIFREYSSPKTGEKGSEPPVKKERQTIHIMDNATRVALIETSVTGERPQGVPRRMTRYQLSNHLNSVSLELDQDAQILSYEEYTPYGMSTFQAQVSQLEVPKRYRFNGKERDDETGLYYYGTRYYAPWISRWINADPNGISDGLNVFVYVRCNPVILSDPNGAESKWLNRGIGALQLIGGTLEVVAGAAGIAAPTGVTQVLGAVAVVHGSDTVATGLLTLWTGEVKKTVTEMAATEGAKALGASDKTAERIGMVTDLVAGVGPGVGIALTKKATTTALIEGSKEVAEHAAPDVASEVTSHAAPAAAEEAAAHAAPKAAAGATTSELATQAAPEAAEKVAVEVAPEAAEQAAVHAAPHAATEAATEAASHAAPQAAIEAAADTAANTAAKTTAQTTTKAAATNTAAKAAKPTAKAAKAARPPNHDWHHVFAKEGDLAQFFKRMGINIHKVGKYLPPDVHSAIHAPNPGKWARGWNEEWAAWIMEQTKNGNWVNLTKRGVNRQMHRMLEQYGIAGYQWTGRHWYTGVSDFLK